MTFHFNMCFTGVSYTLAKIWEVKTSFSFIKMSIRELTYFKVSFQSIKKAQNRIQLPLNYIYINNVKQAWFKIVYGLILNNCTHLQGFIQYYDIPSGDIPWSTTPSDFRKWKQIWRFSSFWDHVTGWRHTPWTLLHAVENINEIRIHSWVTNPFSTTPAGQEHPLL